MRTHLTAPRAAVAASITVPARPGLVTRSEGEGQAAGRDADYRRGQRETFVPRTAGRQYSCALAVPADGPELRPPRCLCSCHVGSVQAVIARSRILGRWCEAACGVCPDPETRCELRAGRHRPFARSKPGQSPLGGCVHSFVWRAVLRWFLQGGASPMMVSDRCASRAAVVLRLRGLGTGVS